MKQISFFLIVLLLGPLAYLQADDIDLDVMSTDLLDGPKSQMLHRYLLKQANAALDRREKAYETIKTEEDAREYQRKTRAFFMERLGGFAERTPLNEVTLGRIECDGFRVEKVIFESRPHFHVTGLLFLPTGKGPFPGVLVPCGHSGNGKGEVDSQRLGCTDNSGGGTLPSYLMALDDRIYAAAVSYTIA